MRQKLIPSRLGKWRNWAGTIERHGIEFCSPVDLDSLCSVVRSAADSGQSIRPVGSTHSFSGVAAPDQLLCDLSRLSGITNIDYIPGGAVVSVLGGTVLRDLGPALWRSGLAMQNMGDIDRQTIAGAISTGTHGTGIGFGSLSTQVVGLRIVTAAGEVLSCSPHERPDVFAAALVGLGLLGVIYEVDLRCDDAYLVRTEGVTMPYRQVIEELDDLLTNDHFEFLRFPSSPDVVAVIRNRVPTETELDQQGPLARSFDTAVSTCGFWLLQRLSDRTPITKDALNSAANAVWGSGRSTIAPRTWRSRARGTSASMKQNGPCQRRLVQTSRSQHTRWLGPSPARLRPGSLPEMMPGSPLLLASPASTWHSTAQLEVLTRPSTTYNV